MYYPLTKFNIKIRQADVVYYCHSNQHALLILDKLKERLDFMLRESLTENSYISSITAHLGYWTSQDCAQYLLLQIYSYKEVDPKV